jgi:hypothetical protein
MKKLVITLLATLALAVVVALPASATSKEPTGTAFHMLQGTPTTFTAGAAFYIGNCWLVESSADALGKYTIALDVDGTPRAESYTQFSTLVLDGVSYNQRCWVWNFPDGMSAGTSHTFIEHWFAPCYATPGPCSKPNALVERYTLSLTVDFS